MKASLHIPGERRVGLGGRGRHVHDTCSRCNTFDGVHLLPITWASHNGLNFKFRSDKELRVRLIFQHHHK